LLSFNLQGNKPIDFIANIVQITEFSNVLIVGCGAGGTAVHLAEMTKATVHGIDLSSESIRIANEVAAKSSARDKLFFKLGDANALDFPPNTFNVVITEFMAFFLQAQAFKGFLTVLKPGGLIAWQNLSRIRQSMPKQIKRSSPRRKAIRKCSDINSTSPFSWSISTG